MESEQPNNQSIKKKLLIGFGGLALVLIAIVAVLLIWIVSSPEGGVKMSNELEYYALKYIKKHQLINDKESLIAYYDASLSLNGTQAAILTNQRLLYHNNGLTTSIYLEDIDGIEHRKDSLIGDIIEVRSKGGEIMKIEIAPFNQGESFYKALTNVWKTASTPKASPMNIQG